MPIFAMDGLVQPLQLPAEGLAQQRLFQFVEGYQFPLVERLEAFGLGLAHRFFNPFLGVLSTLAAGATGGK